MNGGEREKVKKKLELNEREKHQEKVRKERKIDRRKKRFLEWWKRDDLSPKRSCYPRFKMRMTQKYSYKNFRRGRIGGEWLGKKCHSNAFCDAIIEDITKLAEWKIKTAFSFSATSEGPPEPGGPIPGPLRVPQPRRGRRPLAVQLDRTERWEVVPAAVRGVGGQAKRANRHVVQGRWSGKSVFFDYYVQDKKWQFQERLLISVSWLYYNRSLGGQS